MAWVLLPILAIFALGIVSFFYGVRAANDDLLFNTFAKLWCVGLSRHLMNSTNSTEMFSDLLNNNRIRFLWKYF